MRKSRFCGLLFLALLLACAQQGLLSQTNQEQAKPAQTTSTQTSPVKGSPSETSEFWSKIKFELSTSVSYQKSLIDSSYFHQYSPPFLSGAYESLAEQTVKVRGEEGWGFNIGAAYFPSTNLGIQFLFDYAKPKLAGPSTAYDVWLNYALTFDASPPYPLTFDYTYQWPETAGDITEMGFSLNGVFRLPISKKLAIQLSGGLTYFDVEGKTTGIAFSYYWWEDGWFRGRVFNVKYKVGGINDLGFNLGADLTWVLFSNMCLVLDARYFGCPSDTRKMEIINEGLVTRPSPAFEEILFERIKEIMNLQDLTVNPSFYRINIGLKTLF